MIDQTHLDPVVAGNLRRPLETIALPVRQAAGSIKARAERVSRILSSSAAHPDVITSAKDELAALYKEVGALWSQL